MSLAVFLNQLHANYNRPELLSSDPLEFVHRYSDPHDQEAIALLSAVLAYGNVKQIRKSIADAVLRMEAVADGPADFVRRLGRESTEFRAQADRSFRSFTHRFNRGRDLVLLFRLLSRSWQKHGSLGAHFLGFLDTDAPDIGDALSGLIAELRNWAGKSRPKSFEYFLTSPADGSCCKRWCMFLRWMGRHDAVDPGLWTEMSPLRAGFPRGRFLRSRQLVIPLDTHTGRITQYLELTRRKTLDWKTALEVTRNLRLCDPTDPTRYDFAISRLGILDLCQRRYREEICTRCELVRVCKFARKKRHPRAKVGV